MLIIHCWAAVLLAAIGIQAAVPAGAPLQLLHGSAFSSTTVEVAVVSPRRDETVEAVTAPSMPDPLLPWIGAQSDLLPLASASHEWLSTAAGLAVHRIRSWHPSPRAPPLA